jgi:hypothetical protein
VESWGEGGGGRWGFVGADRETGGVGPWHSGRGAATEASSEYGGELREDYRLPLGCDWAGQLIPHGLGRQYLHLQSSSAQKYCPFLEKEILSFVILFWSPFGPALIFPFSLCFFFEAQGTISSVHCIISQFHVTRAIEKHVDLDHGGREAKPTVKFNTTCFRVI